MNLPCGTQDPVESPWAVPTYAGLSSYTPIIERLEETRAPV